VEKQETEVRKEAARRKGNGKLRGACAWFVIRDKKKPRGEGIKGKGGNRGPCSWIVTRETFRCSKLCLLLRLNLRDTVPPCVPIYPFFRIRLIDCD